MVVIDPSDRDRKLLDERGIRFIQTGLTAANYKEILSPLLKEGGGTGFCVNLSVDVSSLDVMNLCRHIGAFYIDTVVEHLKDTTLHACLVPSQNACSDQPNVCNGRISHQTFDVRLFYRDDTCVENAKYRQ